MNFLKKKIELNVWTLIAIVVITGVVSAHVAQSSFGQGIAEFVAIIGLFFIGLGVWIFLHLWQELFGKKKRS